MTFSPPSYFLPGCGLLTFTTNVAEDEWVSYNLDPENLKKTFRLGIIYPNLRSDQLLSRSTAKHDYARDGETFTVPHQSSASFTGGCNHVSLSSLPESCSCFKAIFYFSIFHNLYNYA